MARWTLIFWEPTASPHKADLIGALSRSDRVASCRAIAQSDISAERRKLGWDLTADERALFSVGPTPAQVAAIVGDAPPETVHIFSGIRHTPCVEQALGLVVAARGRFGILSEPRASEGMAGALRLAQSLLTEGRVRRQAAFVLAIGRNGPSWFRRAAYPAGRIFPYGYFVAPPPEHDGRAFDGRLRVAFLGRLTRAKGIHLFLDAIDRLTMPLDVSVAGTGPEEAAVRQAQAAARYPFRFAGALPHADVTRFLGEQDVLVVPSTTTDDGWGVVVGEALMAGTAVVATGRVGASSCLDHPGNGRRVDGLDGRAIARAVADLATPDHLDAAARSARAAWARMHLTGEAGARRLLAVLDHVFAGGPAPAPFPPTAS